MGHTNLEEHLKSFKTNHFLNANFIFFCDKIQILYKEFKKKRGKKEKDAVVLDLFIQYIQITEILFINIYASSRNEETFPFSLFISSNKLKSFTNDNLLKQSRISEWFLNLILKVQKPDPKKVDSLERHKSILLECAADYLENFEVLNAYKHGYRIHGKYIDNELLFKTADGKSFPLTKTDSTLIYFSREIEEDGQTIYENTINFNIERLFTKAMFLCYLLANLRVAMLVGKGLKIKERVWSYKIEDNRGWTDSFGTTKIKRGIYKSKS